LWESCFKFSKAKTQTQPKRPAFLLEDKQTTSIIHKTLIHQVSEYLFVSVDELHCVAAIRAAIKTLK
jgi:DNA-binding NarL/FixJ family response regulator